MVGIETLDDVSVVDRTGRIIREQDKHYTSNRPPLADRSKDFWKSLFIWLAAIESGEVNDLEKTEFHLVTNKVVSKGLVYDLLKLQNGSTDSSWQNFLKKLRAAGASPPKGLKTFVNGVLRHPDDALIAFVKRIRVTDGRLGSSGKSLREQIADALHLERNNVDDVLNGLLGWIHDTALLLIRDGRPAWFSWEDFGERYRRELFAHCDVQFFRETAAADIAVTDQERAKYRQNLFVKQLLWLGLSEGNEQLIEAIDDVYRSVTETVRLTKQGVVTPRDFCAFDDRLVAKWKSLRRVHAPRPLPSDEAALQKLGKMVLDYAMDHREMLAGQQTQEWYLTRGAFHKLADEPRLGWHPNYEQNCEQLAKEKGNRDPDN